ncbi:MAG: beta-ketoacyl-ACP synthase III [bacterium]
MAKYQPDPAIGIVGVGSDAPEGILSNFDLEKMVETSDEWIVARTGIRTRHVADAKTSTSTLATSAAKKALADAGLTAADVDLIVIGTATPDMLFPSTACLVQANLGAEHAAAFDLAAACSGFIYGLNVAAGMIRNGTHDTALVIGAETLSKIMDFTDRSTCVLFGDGAGAAVVRRVEKGRGILSTRIMSDGTLGEMLMLPAGGSARPATHETVDQRLHYIKMSGNNVFKSAVKSMADVVTKALEDAELSAEAIDLFIPHQANLRIIEATARKLGIPMDKVFVNVDRYGNTSAASIPLAIDEARHAGVLREGHVVSAVAFGAGFTWGSAVLRF